ncbi:MAG: GspE/PulE family protein [Thermoleophilaceae bacterium]
MPEDPRPGTSTASLDVEAEVDALEGVGGDNGAQGTQTPPPALTPPRRRGGARRSLPDVLVELGFVSPERMEQVLVQATQGGRSAEEVLREEGELSSEQLARATAERFGLDFVDMTLYKPDLTAVSLVSSSAAKRYSAVPIGHDESGTLLVAMADPSNILALDDLKLMTGQDRLRPVVAVPEDIASLVSRAKSLDDAVADATADEDEDDAPLVGEMRESADDAPVIKLVNSIIAEAVEEGASDIHFEPEGRDMRVRFRIDGVLGEVTTIPRRMVAGVVSRVKIMGQLDIAERRLPQDGRIGLTVDGHPVDVRIVTLPTNLGEGIIMRILDKEQVLLTLDALGMRDDALARFETGIRQSYGAVLVTGPTGSGKSTTLYAGLNAINTVEKKIITIEDPVEYQLPGINQIGVNLKAGLSFATGLRSILRADPDIIMVGEIRDSDTARIAIESALTGHLVLSTLHTNDAPSAITRLTEMNIEPFLSSSAVDVIVAQRLARKLCTYCKRAISLKADALKTQGFAVKDDIEAYEAVGCARCNYSGYRGRIGLYEVMLNSDEIRELTIQRSSADEIRKVAIGQGMEPLRDDGLEKVRLGITSIEEVLRVS